MENCGDYNTSEVSTEDNNVNDGSEFTRTSKHKKETKGSTSKGNTNQEEKYLFGFQLGDIITCTCGHCLWDEKYVLVRDFDLKEKRILGLVYDEYGPSLEFDDEKEEEWSNYSQKLELVQFNLFKLPNVCVQNRYAKPEDLPPLNVGDKVIGISGRVTGYYGEVIAIVPDPNLMNPYIVEMKHCKTGDNLISIFDNPWYPQEKRIDARNRFYCKRTDLRHFDYEKEFNYSTPGVISEKPTKIKENILEKKLENFFYWYLKNVLIKSSSCRIIDLAKIPVAKDVSDFQELLSKDKGSIKEATKTLGIFFYELITGFSERISPSYTFDGYPLLHNPDFSPDFLEAICKMANGKIFNKKQLEKILSQVQKNN